MTKNESTMITVASSGVGKEIAKKFVTKKQIASIVFFLTSKEAGSIIGTSTLSNGGWTAGK